MYTPSVSASRFSLVRKLFAPALLLWAVVAGAQPVETTPPPIYTARLAAHLTPFADVLALPSTSAAPSDSGLSLLDERLLAVDESGRRTLVYHFAYKTLTDAGIKSNSEDVYSFRKNEQKAYLVLAETIQPDGRRQAVQPDAVLVQSPQRQAQYALYDDASELKIIFPNVAPGVITHGIVVIEDLVAKIPGEFTQSFVWGGTWGTQRLHLYVDVPESLHSRVKLETLGAGVPKPTRAEPVAGRRSLEWLLSPVRGTLYETARAPAMQIGPAIHLSSVKSWDDVHAWYRGLMAGRGEVSAELAALTETWVPANAGRAATIGALHAHVADDVRYVGLEFGSASHQPHPCNEVWANRYGDCKDKANLLVALLRHRGIEASVALLNTSHVGLIDRRVPDYQVFTHAIVAIPEGDHFLFCDPTIAYSTPGMIGASSSDRDIFIITEARGKWARTPTATDGALNYAFDLTLGASGDLAGWLTMTSEGVYGAGDRRRYTRLEPTDLRSSLSRTIRGFYPAAEVIDAECLPSERGTPLVVKAYFTVPGGAGADQKHAVAFPLSEGLLVNVGDNAERQTTFYVDRDSISVKARIKVPAGYVPEQQPGPFRLEANFADFGATWNFDQGGCVAELKLNLKVSALPRADFGRLYQGVQSLKAWAAKPLLLATSQGLPRKDVAAVPEIDFPLMPTGDGQINLVDQRYPDTGDPALRRLALERVAQYFPKDKNTLFRAGVRLALLDWDGSRDQAAHDRLTGLLQVYAGQVSLENYGWAESIDGFILRDLKREPEALATLERVSRNPQLSADRRARSGVEAANLMTRAGVPGAIDLLLEIAALPEGGTGPVEAKIAQLYLAANQTELLEKHLRALVAQQPDKADESLTALLKATAGWNAAAEGERLLTLCALIRQIQPAPGEELAAALPAAENRAHWRIARSALQRTLETPLFSTWFSATEPRQTQEAYTKAIAAANDANDSAKALRLCLQSVGLYEVDDDFPERLWRAANYAEWAQRQAKGTLSPDFCDRLLDLCDLLTPSNDYYYEGRLIRAKRIGAAGDRTAETAMLQAIRTSANVPDRYFLHTTRLLATNLENARDYPGALALYASIERLAPDFRTACDSLNRAVLIHLDRGDDAAALRVIDLLRQVPESILNQTEAKAQIAELITLAKTGRAKEVWSAGRAWWPDWLKFTEFIGENGTAPSTVIPVITDLHALGVALGEAKRDQNISAYGVNLAQLMSAARWFPSLGVEVGSLYETTVAVLPARAKDYRNLVITVLQQPHPAEIAALTGRQLQLAIHGIDGGRPLLALKACADYAQRGLPDDDSSRAMRRLRGLAAAATKQDLGPTAEALAADLADPQLTDRRSGTVTILADLYRLQAQSADEEALLRRELSNPVIAGDAAATKSLQTRLTKLVGERDFGQALTAWRQQLGIPWYDYAQPASLDDPRLKNLEAVLGAPQKYFTPQEQVKLQLLAATDLRRPLADRQRSVRLAVQLLQDQAPTYTRLNQITTSVVANEAFDDEVKLTALWMTLAYLCAEHRTTDYQHWRHHALVERFNDVVKQNIGLLDELMALDRNSIEAIQALAAKFAAEPITPFGGFVMSDLFDFLVQTGDLAAAEKFVAGVASWRFTENVEDTAQARQLDYARRLRSARALDRVYQQIIAVTVKRYPDRINTLPAPYTDLRVRPELVTCGRAETRDAALYRIQRRDFKTTNFSLLGPLLRAIGNEPDVEKFYGELFGAAMAAADGDELKSALAGEFLSSTDSDNPAVRVEILAVLKREIDPQRHPSAYLAMRLFETKVADRLGQLTDVELALADIAEPTARFYQTVLNLEVYNHRDDLVALRRTVDGIKPNMLLSVGLLSDSLAAFERLGLKEELAAAQSVAREEIRRNVTESWSTLTKQPTIRALRFAEQLRDPTVLPAAWVADLGSSLSDPYLRALVGLTDAALRQDWSAAEKFGAELNRDYPTHYRHYWTHGLAAAKLGHRQEAIAALTVYVQYCNDEVEHREAAKLLAELKAGT